MLTHDEINDAIRAMLRRASVVDVDDTGPQQLLTLTGLASEQPRKVVRSQPFGFSSVPPAGAEGLLLTQGGRADRCHFLNPEHPTYRPTKTQLGGTVIYDANGQAVSLVKNSIRIVGTGTLTIVAPNIVLDGAVTLGGPAGSGVPVSKQGTVDSGGYVDDANLSTMVKVV